MSEPEQDGARGVNATRIALSTVAVALAVAHVVWPGLKIDTITITLLLVAALPWLQTLFASISTPLFSVQFRELKRRVETLDGKVESSSRLMTAYEARDRARRSDRASNVDATMTDLTQQYNDVRANMKSGPARTDVMTGLVGQMLAAIEAGASVDIDRGLHSADRGERLTAYAALYADPDPTKAAALANSLIQFEDSPFGQYWALQSLRRIVETSPANTIDDETIDELLAYAKTLPPGSDRAYEVNRLLRVVDQSTR